MSERGMTREEFQELLKSPCPGTMPKQVDLGVSERLAEAARANPESVRVVARGKDNEVIIERPRTTELIEVTEVDAQGRPAKIRCYEAERGGWSMIEYRGGYREIQAVVHQYNPVDALKGNK